MCAATMMAQEKLLHAANVQQLDFCKHIVAMKHLHLVESLLQQGHLSCLGRFPQGDVLSLGKEVAQDHAILLPPDEILPGDISVVNERRIHVFITNLLSLQI